MKRVIENMSKKILREMIINEQEERRKKITIDSTIKLLKIEFDWEA